MRKTQHPNRGLSRPDGLLGALRRLALASLAIAITVASSFAAPLPTLVETAVIPAGGTVNYITLSPNGTQLYASSRNSVTGAIQLLVINTTTHAIAHSVPLGNGVPQQIAFSPNGARAYIAISQSAFSVQTADRTRVVVLDTATRTIVATIIVGAPFGNIGVAVTPDGSRVYVTDRAESDVYVIETATNTVVDIIDLADVHGTGPDLGTLAIDITPDGTRAYIANRHTATVSVIRLADRVLLATIPLTIGPTFTLDSLSIAPNGKRGYVTYDTDSRVAIIDTDPTSATFNTQIGIIPTTGLKLREIAVRDDGFFAFVSSSGTNEALILDLDPASPTVNTEIDGVPVGLLPAGIAVHAVRPLAYVANSGANTISVLAPAQPRQLKKMILSELKALLPTGNKAIDLQLAIALFYINVSLSPDYWKTDIILTSKGGCVFDAEKVAVCWLQNIVACKAAIAPQALGAIKALVDVDRALAQAQLDAAIAGNGNASWIAKAKLEMTAGAADNAAGKYQSAIEHYKLAWQYSRKALGL